MNKTYLETAQTTLAWSLPSVSRTCHLWFVVSLPFSMTFHPHPEVMQPFLVSSDTNFFYHPSTYFNSLEASCFLTKWLLLHKKQLLADFCGLLGSYSPSLMTSKHSSPCLHLLANLYWTHLNSASSSWSCLICCFCSSIIPTYCVSTLTFHKGGAMSQSADTANADADEDVAVVLKSLCFSCPPTIVDKQCKNNVILGVLIYKKMKSCVAYLWLTQSFGTNVQMVSSRDFWNTDDPLFTSQGESGAHQAPPPRLGERDYSLDGDN
jgi:hypothetical protein